MLNSNNACPSIETGGRSQFGLAGTGSCCSAMTSASMCVPPRSEKEEKTCGSLSYLHQRLLLRKTRSGGSQFATNVTEKILQTSQQPFNTQLFRVQAARIEAIRVFLQNYRFSMRDRARTGFWASGFHIGLSSPTTRASSCRPSKLSVHSSGGLQSRFFEPPSAPRTPRKERSRVDKPLVQFSHWVCGPAT